MAKNKDEEKIFPINQNVATMEEIKVEEKTDAKVDEKVEQVKTEQPEEPKEIKAKFVADFDFKLVNGQKEEPVRVRAGGDNESFAILTARNKLEAQYKEQINAGAKVVYAQKFTIIKGVVK
jgi:hypothetical protein